MIRRPLVAGIVLLAAYIALSFVNDPRGSLGSDTGGKVATLEVMAKRHRLDPDVGYWAEQWDRDASLHPLYSTGRVEGRWVQVTTLPMLVAAYPLYRAGGYRLALLLPMLGAVAAAFAARALARRFGGGDGLAAFWIVGLASPMAIYALDFWEHSLGVALIAWAAVLIVDLVDGASWWRAPVAGVLVGAAASLRTEALVYAAILGAAVGLAVLLARRPVRAVVIGAGMGVGLVAMVAANAALEIAVVGSTLRVGRATGAAVGASASGTQTRIDEAFVTAASPFASVTRGAELAGVLLLGVLVALAVFGVKDRNPGPPARAAGAVAGALYVARLATGLDFVPGMVAAAPLAAVGIVHGWSSRSTRLITGAALAALPLVWAFQFTGGAGPQWGGRYILPTGLLLTVVGVLALPRLIRWARIELVALSIGVTLLGVVWLSVRSHSVADAAGALQRRPEPVLVSRVAFLEREFGAFYGEKRALTAITRRDFDEAIAVLRRAGVDRFAEIQVAPAGRPRAMGEYRPVERSQVRLFEDVDLAVTTYEIAR